MGYLKAVTPATRFFFHMASVKHKPSTPQGAAGTSTAVASQGWVAFVDALRTLFRRPWRTPEEPQPVSREAIQALTHAPVNDLGLYERALRHRSLLRNQPHPYQRSNERLEFLGDAVLGMAVAEYLFHRYPEQDEGFLTRIRAKLVSGKALARYAKAIDLNALILMSEDMERAQGRQNPSILANAFEAVLGALYLDQGLQAARRFTLSTIETHVDLDDLITRRENYKSLLLEYVQGRGWDQPYYRVLSEHGPSHAREFKVEVILNNRPQGRGSGSSKKKAEQRAAREALNLLLKTDDTSSTG